MPTKIRDIKNSPLGHTTLAPQDDGICNGAGTRLGRALSRALGHGTADFDYGPIFDGAGSRLGAVVMPDGMQTAADSYMSDANIVPFDGGAQTAAGETQMPDDVGPGGPPPPAEPPQPITPPASKPDPLPPAPTEQPIQIMTAMQNFIRDGIQQVDFDPTAFLHSPSKINVQPSLLPNGVLTAATKLPDPVIITQTKSDSGRALSVQEGAAKPQNGAVPSWAWAAGGIGLAAVTFLFFKRS